MPALLEGPLAATTNRQTAAAPSPGHFHFLFVILYKSGRTPHVAFLQQMRQKLAPVQLRREAKQKEIARGPSRPSQEVGFSRPDSIPVTANKHAARQLRWQQTNNATASGAAWQAALPAGEGKNLISHISGTVAETELG